MVLLVVLLVGVGALLRRRDDGDAPSPAADGPTSIETTTTTLAVDPTTASTAPATTPPSTGSFTVAPGGTGVVGTGGVVRTYSAEVEDGIGVDPTAFAALVDATLADARSWVGAGDVRLQRVGPGEQPSFRVRLATPATVDELCAPLDTAGIYSCRNGADVMLNLERWLHGATPAEMPLTEYRQYMVNHEVGHALGHDHEGCPAPDALAPVMLQQTKGLQGCRPNPWPLP